MSDAGSGINEAEAAALARWAGLTMPPERLPRLAISLASARAAVADIASFDVDISEPVDAPFDPSWPADDEDGAR